MLRVIFGLLLLIVIAASVGYYFGAHRPNLQASEAVQPTEPAPPPLPTEGGQRSRSEPVRTAPELPSTPAPDIAPVPGEPPMGEMPLAQTADSGPLESRNLGLPVANMKVSDLRDMFNESRGGGERRHEATDILAPRGTPVYAVDTGIIQKLFTSKPGGLTIYQYDGAQEYCYYYAHLDRYAEGLREGQLVRRGDVIGYVGFTGNADPSTPHLHFAIFKLGPEKKWWGEGNQPVNPYPVLLSAMKQAQPHQSTPRARNSR